MDKILINKDKNDIISILIDYIDNFSVIIYEKKNSESYQMLIKIIDKLELIISDKSTLELENNFKIYIKELTDKLPDLLEAFENNDNVLISDILKYEIKPLLEEIGE